MLFPFRSQSRLSRQLLLILHTQLALCSPSPGPAHLPSNLVARPLRNIDCHVHVQEAWTC